MSRWVIIVTIVCALAIVSLAQVSTIAGIWYGTFSPSGRPSPVSLVFESHGADWVGSLLLADGRGIPLRDVTLSGDTITFGLELPQVKATFKGTLSTDRKDLRGEFTQNGTTSRLEVSRDSKKIEDAMPSMDPHELIEMMTSLSRGDRPIA